MAKISDIDKKKMIGEFEMAKSLEVSAAELYEKIASDADIEQQNIKTAFKNLAGDEQRHNQIPMQLDDNPESRNIPPQRSFYKLFAVFSFHNIHRHKFGPNLSSIPSYHTERQTTKSATHKPQYEI